MEKLRWSVIAEKELLSRAVP